MKNFANKNQIKLNNENISIENNKQTAKKFISNIICQNSASNSRKVIFKCNKFEIKTKNIKKVFEIKKIKQEIKNPISIEYNQDSNLVQKLFKIKDLITNKKITFL